jgi:hypothetical protein
VLGDAAHILDVVLEAVDFSTYPAMSGGFQKLALIFCCHCASQWMLARRLHPVKAGGRLWTLGGAPWKN